MCSPSSIWRCFCMWVYLWIGTFVVGISYCKSLEELWRRLYLIPTVHDHVNWSYIYVIGRRIRGMISWIRQRNCGNANPARRSLREQLRPNNKCLLHMILVATLAQNGCVCFATECRVVHLDDAPHVELTQIKVRKQSKVTNNCISTCNPSSCIMKNTLWPRISNYQCERLVHALIRCNTIRQGRPPFSKVKSMPTEVMELWILCSGTPHLNTNWHPRISLNLRGSWIGVATPLGLKRCWESNSSSCHFHHNQLPSRRTPSDRSSNSL